MSCSTGSRNAATLADLALASTACDTTAGDGSEDTAESGPVSRQRGSGSS